MQINNAFFDGSNLTQEEIEAIAEVEAAGLATYDFTNTDVTDLTSGLAGLGADFAEAAAAEAAAANQSAHDMSQADVEAAAAAAANMAEIAAGVEAYGGGFGPSGADSSADDDTGGFDGHW